MKALTEASAQAWRALPAAASPWGRRPVTIWSLIVEGWRETMDIYARAGRYRLPWGPF
jgi:hypothetical protein